MSHPNTAHDPLYGATLYISSRDLKGAPHGRREESRFVGVRAANKKTAVASTCAGGAGPPSPWHTQGIMKACSYTD